MILKDRPYPIVAQAMGIIWIVLVGREAITIILIQPLVGTNPYEAITVLKNTVGGILREPLLNRDMLKSEVPSSKFQRRECGSRSRLGNRNFRRRLICGLLQGRS